MIRPRGWHLVERHYLVDGEPVAASLFDFGLVVFHNAREQLERGIGAVLLPAQARVAPGGAALGAGVRVRGGPARPAARLDQVHGADRDDPGRVRDGRDPLRAARPLVRAQRGPLGLHLQLHQEGRRGAARPRAGDDDRAVHARLLGAAREDVPRARRPRDRRDGGVHPLPPRSGGERDRARAGARGQAARVGGRVRRHLGRPPRPRPGRARVLRRRARRPAEPARPAARRRPHHPRAADRLRRSPAARSPRGPPRQLQRRRPLPRRLAAGSRRRRDRQPDGGRRHRRDLPRPDLVVACRPGSSPSSKSARRSARSKPPPRRKSSSHRSPSRRRCWTSSRRRPTRTSPDRTSGVTRSSDSRPAA